MSFGYEAAMGQFPVHVQLSWVPKFGARSICQASIIHNDILITAGHCAMGSEWTSKAYIGSLSRFNEDKRGIVVGIKSSCILKGYTLTHTANATCLSAGHGFSSNDKDTHKTLRAMPFKLYTKPINDTRQDRTYYMAAHPIWAGKSCPGDSGSAVVCYDKCSGDRTRAQAVGIVIDGPQYACIKGKPVPFQVADFHKLKEPLEELFKRCLSIGETSIGNSTTTSRKATWTNFDQSEEDEGELL